MERNLASVRPRKGEKRVDQQCQVIGLFEDAPDALSITLPARMVAKSDLSHAADRGQRSPQLVRDVRREATELGKGFLDLAEGNVEDPCQVAELVVWILDRETFIEVVRGQPFGMAGHPLERPESAARQPMPAEAGDRQRHREPEDESERELAPLGAQCFLAESHADQDASAADVGRTAEHAKRGPVTEIN